MGYKDTGRDLGNFFLIFWVKVGYVESTCVGLGYCVCFLYKIY